MRKRKLFIFIPLIILTILIFLAIAFLIFATIVEYRPKPIEVVEIKKGADKKILNAETIFKALTWNIGYCGLDKENDFFYDGGLNVTAKSKDKVLNNFEKVIELLQEESCDFNILQEIDVNSKRSFHFNEKENLSNLFADKNSSFAANYDTAIVPIPLTEPLGRVHSGILTLSDYEVTKSERHQLPGAFSWPTRTVNLKRCLLISEFQTSISGKNLYVINLHLSAYDADGVLRKQEMEYLKNIALKFYNEGHWVIAGGDWNSLFPGVEKDLFKPYNTPEEFLEWIEYIPYDFIGKDWKWAFDKSVPSVRLLEKPYVEGENYTTVIDGFLVSPNVEIIGVNTINLNFEVSDHHPVIAEFKLIK